MPKTQALAADMDTARQLFFEKGKNPVGWVPEVIARSWQRCAQRLDNTRTPPPLRVDSTQLNDRRDFLARLRRIAQPEMDALAELVSDSESLVLLADDDGLILDAAGGLDFLRKAQQVFLQPGVRWSEQDRGTNAIGTALVEEHPVIVRGKQHYLDANAILSCAAAPIVSPRGEVLGVLDVSGDSEHMHRQALGMLRLAIQITEHRLMRDLATPGSLLRFHHRHDLLGSHREGILMLDETQIVGANRAALQLLGTDWQELLGSDADSWLPLPANNGGNHNGIVTSCNGQRFHGIIDNRHALQVAVSVNPRSDGDQHYIDAETQHLLDKACRVLDADIAVLISGETGAGKEVFARRLHGASKRGGGPFVAVNCAALPESLIESELFGYEGGAFTGARRKGMPGRVREADGGVLFLDEIGDMPLALQARLLRVLQDREVHPLGGGQPVAVDFALICATNRDLLEMVAAGGFRADLFYRIQDFTLRLPPLRERSDRRRIIRELVDMLGGNERNISLNPKALECLTHYPWPGNLRQLTSTLRTLLALTDEGEVIDVTQLPEEIRRHGNEEATDASTESSLQIRTRQAIERALIDNDGNVSAAARELGIHRSTIYRWLSRQHR
jgi:sigma-54 dependent transcriptional regulator, acetoin dehydrogenase operon transcriptional activator AcoR